jgi:phage gp45-like
MSDARLSPQATRTTVVDVDDTGPQQFVHASGLYGQDIGKMVRIQHFGLTSVPPAGSEGHGVAIGGGNDRLFALGMEHPKYRPTGTPIGCTVLYDMYGDVVSIVQQSLRIVHASKVTIQAPQIELIGNVTLGGAAGSGVPAAKQGTVDTAGNADVTNLATKVNVN